jgi:AcrR family transcriptional regulator
MQSVAPIELPVVDATPPSTRERADAARNRARILEAAERLFAEHGPEGVSMDAVAKAACVGKGTLYRRFGDRENLLLAMFGEREQVFQDEILHGPAPLGPGADAIDRLHAFGPAYLALLEDVGPLIAALEERLPGARFAMPPYRAYRLHLRVLLERAAPEIDAEFCAEALMAIVNASFVAHLRRQGFDRDRLVTGWCRTVDALARR